jgi:hypothetical protein
MPQMLLYERAVPITRQRHGDLSVRAGRDFHYARAVNSVPLMEAEFPSATAEFPVVFATTGDEIVPVVLLGLRDSENLMVGLEGQWLGRYVPAFLRRYPFVFSTADSGRSFTLCIDESFSGLNAEGRGERLFDADGEPTQYTKSVLNFLQAYQAQFQRTQAFCRRLRELDLFEPMQAQFTIKDGQRLTMTGFSTIARDRLKALPGETLADLARTEILEQIYQHLGSLRHFNAMIERMPAAPAPTAAAPTAVAH